MREKSRGINEHISPGRLVIPSLAISGASMEPPGIVTSLLLIEIAATFGFNVGVGGQIRTAASTVGIISALAMGALSVRFDYKSLLTAGLGAFAVSALGCTIAPNFGSMLFFFSISGLAGAMVGPMTNSLVGELLPLEKRSSAIGTLFAARAFTYLAGAQIIGYVGGLWGWRMAFIAFVFPISVLSLLTALRGLPIGIRARSSGDKERNYVEGFKCVFTSRSPFACLFGTALSSAAWGGILTYSASFFRQRYLMPRTQASILLSGVALCFMVSTYLGGRLVNRFGRKPLTTLSVLVFSLFTIAVTNSPNMVMALVAMLLTSAFSAVRRTAIFSLTLEQVPGFRGTMMSLNAAFYSLGGALGSGLGGLALLLYDWGFVGLSLGVIGLAAAVIVQLIVVDPTRYSVDK